MCHSPIRYDDITSPHIFGRITRITTMAIIGPELEQDTIVQRAYAEIIVDHLYNRTWVDMTPNEEKHLSLATYVDDSHSL